MDAIVVNNLTKRFGKFTAVEQISFKVRQGEIFGFLGANGAGKSTTIRMLIGILEPTSGDAFVGGYSIKNEPDLVKKNIGYMSQKFSLYNDLTPVENINFYASIYGVPRSQRKDRIRELIKMADLESHQTQLTRNLSGAWRQRRTGPWARTPSTWA